MLKAIHAQEDRESAKDKARQVVDKLEALRLPKAASLVREGIAETLAYMALPREPLAEPADEQHAGASDA